MVMKISVKQLFWFGYAFETGIALLIAMTPTIQQVGQDAWLSGLIAAIEWFALGFIHLRLSLLDPEKSLFELSEWLLGKWAGKLFTIPYMIMFISVTGIFIRQFSDFIHLALFNRTPLWALIVPFVLLSWFSVQQGGIEGIARSAEVIGPIILVAFIIIVGLNFGNMHWDRLLPVYADHGAWEIVVGSFPMLSFLGESVLITMIVPFVEKPTKMAKPMFESSILTILALIITAAVVVATFSAPFAAKLLYPSYEVVRYISAMEFLQNIDALVVIIWFFSYYIKLNTYFFISSYGVSQWIGIKNWKKVNWFVAGAILVISLLPRTFLFSYITYPKLWVTYILPIHMIALPALLLLIGVIKKRATRPQPSI